MELRVLGGTGVRVSTWCLGAMMFGPMGNPDEDDCVRIIHRALDGGINFIDTADVYSRGRSEEIVGRALRDRRDDVVLATKVHGRMGDDPNMRGNSRRWIVRELEASLRRLGTDHVDLYQLHRPDPDTDLEETLEALTDLVRQGKARAVGTSAFPAWQLVEAHWIAERRGLVRPRCEQCSYSILVRGAERDVFPVARRYGMGVIGYSPLAGGWLTGKYRPGEEPPAGSRMERSRAMGGRFGPRFDEARPEVQRKYEVVDALARVAEKAGVLPAHMALAFTVGHPAVTSAIIGPRTMDQLEDLLAGADVRLAPDVLDAIDDVVTPGTLLDEADRGWEPPWMAPDARRRL
ncbi:MAG TPA: aldo/keto reductase [Actinomycetota bacterium]|nr:aldo/keto reductase [Actinomycetota bacterium]